MGEAGVVSVLLVEDDDEDYLITSDMLQRQDRTRFHLDRCGDFTSALERIRHDRHDIYIVDYRLGAHTGLELVKEAFANRAQAPVILLTGEGDYSIDQEASASGVTDFMLKQELNPFTLERTIRYAISQYHALEQLAASERRYSLAVRAANDGIWDWDLQTDRVYYSPRWWALLGAGLDAQEGTPSTWMDQVHPDDQPGLRLAIEAHLSGRTSLLQFKHRMLHADGSWRWMLARGIAVSDDTGTPARMAGSLSDITVSRLAEDRLRYDALHDSLTGLPNRAYFIERLERAMLRHQSSPEQSCVVLFLDIDRFKLVNDTFSHSVGDRLLVALAGRLAKELRPADTVARLAGDEFTVLLQDIPAAQAADLAIQVADRINHALEDEFEIGDHHLFVSGSTGIALASDASSAADLMRNADIAMYEAKCRANGRYCVYDSSMHQRIAERLEREHDLRMVVEQGRAQVHYQPVIDLATGEVSGFEALARWPSDLPEVPPVEFIPIAEETGLISQLGMQLLNMALVDLARWRASGTIGSDVQMSVNVSGRQLDDPQFPGQVLAAVAAAGVPGRLLHLEITEGTLMREPDRMAHIVTELSASGIGMDLDDFGTGYSSLAALHRFPVSVLKIDRSFVSGMASDGDAIVRSTVALAHALGFKVTAEGIETEAQLGELKALGCEFGQGYLFARPVPAGEIETLLRDWPLR
ncbi:MAG TPA: EAL domain-containing protein [Acidimicrobiales bacterium]|jgi:diguanylate cyclase (GGDEF)-like protein/PAS domain S-box-containing protein|nr:EAL domain-containing protein [Acidimicrobiales bacterium]